MSSSSRDIRKDEEEVKISLPNILSLANRVLPLMTLNANSMSHGGAEPLSRIIITPQVGESPEGMKKELMNLVAC